MTQWQARLGVFIAANLVLVPIIGRLGWLGMETLNNAGATFVAVLLSVAVAAAILVLNIWLLRRAVRAGLPKLGELVCFLVTGLQFVGTIGTGFFSLVNLVAALLT